MSGIAEILVNLGYTVSGSDQRRSETIERLERLGAKVYVGHDASHLEGAHVVVFSSAVARDNVEVAVARQRQIPVIPRAEMLAELMRLKYGIAVAGTHGKTTTTSMIGAVLAEGRIDPTIVVGGRVVNLDANARLGQGEYLVAEAGESDGSLLKPVPTVAVVTTVDDYGHHPAEIRATLAAAKAGFDGRVVTVFQPHRYTRTFYLRDEFVTAFNQTDVLVVMDIYPAGEAPIEGVSAADLAERIRAHGHRNVTYLGGDRARL